MDTSLNEKRLRLFSSGMAVFTFHDGGHYSTVVADTGRKILHYLDSIYNKKPTNKLLEKDMVIALFENEALEQNVTTYIVS